MTPAHAQPAFPVPRAEAEFRALMPSLGAYFERVPRGDEPSFVTAVAAFGPLDLQVTKARDGREAERLRNLYYGVAGGASELPFETIQRWGLAFPREPEMVRERKKQVTDHLPQIRAFVTQMKKTPQITCLARWGFREEWRVNNGFYEQGKLREAIPSPVMGFVPSGKWRTHTSPQAYIAALKVPELAWGQLFDNFRKLPLIAVVRQEGGVIRAIRYGVSNNEVGLLFTAGAISKPMLGERLRTGQKFALLQQVAPDIFYYEAI